jgi:Tol biopolymer transport system component
VGDLDVSPDGREVVYEVLRGGGVSDLQVMPVTGGPARILVAGGSNNRLPNWSPDGKSIVFVSNRAGNSDLWTVPAAGGEPRQLTNWPSAEGNPQWSPDGNHVYFTSNRDVTPFNDVWKVPVTGGEPIRVTSTGGTVNGLAVSLVSPAVFVQSVGGRGGRTVLGKVRPDGTLETLWDRSNVTGISWYGITPKGDSLAINAELPGGGSGSYLISTTTGQGRQVLGRDDLIGDFSRDGRWLAYWTGTATLELGVIDMKDGTARQLTRSPESEVAYWWGADNNTIVFARQSQRRRIAVFDLEDLLARGK